jgi:VanZ family protein
MGAIFFLSAQPSTGEHPWWEVIVRKFGHVTGYALLTALWVWALRGMARRPVLLAACISFAYACTDEFHQTYVSGRTGTPVDVGVDAAGIVLAAWLLSRRRPSPAGEGTIAAGGGVPRSSPARSP